MAFNNSPVGLRWYQRFGGVLGIALSVTVVAIVLFFGGSVWYYYNQIKNGNGELLLQSFYGGFSAADKNDQKSQTEVNRAELELASAPAIGTNNPKVTIVEFVDFKCPNCKAEAPILLQVMQKYGSKVKLIVRNFPVESTHPGANQLAILAQCAYYQGWYWPLHDWLYDNQEALGSNFTAADIDDLNSVFAWDAKKMKECFNSQDAKVLVNKDYSDASRFGVAGTPTFFINGKKVEGVVPFEVWDNFLRNVK